MPFWIIDPASQGFTFQGRSSSEHSFLEMFHAPRLLVQIGCIPCLLNAFERVPEVRSAV